MLRNLWDGYRPTENFREPDRFPLLFQANVKVPGEERDTGAPGGRTCRRAVKENHARSYNSWMCGFRAMMYG